jgi:hypothetical protein
MNISNPLSPLVLASSLGLDFNHYSEQFTTIREAGSQNSSYQFVD